MINASVSEIRRNRIEIDENGYHWVGDLIRKKHVKSKGIFKRIVRDRETSKTTFNGYSDSSNLKPRNLSHYLNSKYI